jgi:hypothetical protein
MILKIFSQKNWRKIAFLTQIKGNFAEKVIISLVFEKNANFFRRKLEKNAENCDHNIDPCSFVFDGYVGICFLFLYKRESM